MPSHTQTLAGKVALITGSSKGLGRAIALRYAELGAAVVINYSKDAAPADEVVKTIEANGRTAIPLQADVSDCTQIERLFAETLKAFKKLDIVVANAGVEKVNIPVVDVTEDDFVTLFSDQHKRSVLRDAGCGSARRRRRTHHHVSYSSTSRPQPGLALYRTIRPRDRMAQSALRPAATAMVFS